jgi:hypothetical protein
MSFAHLLTETIHVASETGRDGYGDATFGSARAVKAAVSSAQNRVMSIDGDERMSSHQIDTAEKIEVTDKVWLPGEDTAVDPGHTPVAFSNESSRRSGKRLYVTFL